MHRRSDCPLDMHQVQCLDGHHPCRGRCHAGCAGLYAGTILVLRHVQQSSSVTQGERGLLDKVKAEGDVPAAVALPDGKLDGKLHSDGTSTDGTDPEEDGEGPGLHVAVLPPLQRGTNSTNHVFSPEVSAAAVPLLSAGEPERDDSGTHVSDPREADLPTPDAAVPVLQPAGNGSGAHVHGDYSGPAGPNITPVQPSANGKQSPAGQTLAKRVPTGVTIAPGQPGSSALQARLHVTSSICSLRGELDPSPTLCRHLHVGTLPTDSTACAWVFQLPWVNLSPTLNPSLNMKARARP